MKIKVIIFGATGMVGEGVLLESLKHDNIKSVLAVNRSPCNVKHPKLKELIHKDFYDYSDVEKQLKGYDACFFCLGVSSIGMKEEDYKKITYDLTIKAAEALSGLNPGMTFCYVSGTGTDSSEHGTVMWARVKGKTENDLSKLPFKAVYLFRPGVIKPIKGQKNVKAVIKVIVWFFPIWKALMPRFVCTLHDVALAMINVSLNGYSKNILENSDITLLAGSESNARTNV
jgi:uncharacterized protein YbjT (DUF2867 family)